jgi:hypothetical protein
VTRTGEPGSLRSRGRWQRIAVAYAAPMKTFGVLVVGLAMASLAACGGDDSSTLVREDAVVRVHSAEPMPAIGSICIGATCRAFSESEDARTAEFSVAIGELTPVEVQLLGDEAGFGTGGDIGPGGCMVVSFAEDGIVVDAGCGDETDTTD